MNIWLWNHYATDMYQNHGGRHYWFAENLNNNGYNATVFCANTYHNKSEKIDTGDKKYVTDKIDGILFVFVKTIPALGNGFARIMNMVIFYINLLSVAKQYAIKYCKPDIILASSVHPLTMVAGIQIARKFKVPCICEIRDLWPEAIFSFHKGLEKSLLGKMLTLGEHWIYKNASALIFTKEGDVNYLIEKGWDWPHGGNVDLAKCYYINNGIDLDAFLNAAEEYTIDDADFAQEKFNVVYVGSIRPVNNVGNILDAAALLKSHSDIQFLIYGDGNQLEALKQRVLEEGLLNVKIKGYINKKLIPCILSKSSVNILNYSQTYYNWSRGNSSNKLFEYMASGKPIISTVKMGYCILEKYNCGFSLAESTPEELSRAILKVRALKNADYETLCSNARKGAADFDFKILTQKLINVIEDLNGEKNIMEHYDA